MNKVCIVGAGAIGGILGARLAAAGACEVSALARGKTLQALREHGWRLRSGDTFMQVPGRAESDAAALGAQDLVILAVKGPALAEVARSLAPLLGPRTVVMPAMNGVPWWFCNGLGELGGTLRSVDPDGAITAAIEPGRVVGCVVHLSAAMPEPGLVQHGMGNGLIVGEAGRGQSERADRIGALLRGAGFDTTVSANVRQDIWFKLWGNMTINPVSAITGATSDRILADPLVRAFCSAAMAEAQAIGSRIGCAIDQTPEERQAMTAKLGRFKTSMLQDAEAGRAIELDALVGAVREIGQRLGMVTPNIDALMGLARLYGQVHGLYPETAA